jgi:uncharacterized membrane protein
MDSPEGFKSGMTDEKLETIIGTLLRVGVLGSATIVLFGGILYLTQHHAQNVNYTEFHMGSSNLRTLPGIFRAAVQLQAEAVIQFGLVLLIATPIARVVLAVFGFYLERDQLYVGVSLIVLSILIFSITHVT